MAGYLLRGILIGLVFGLPVGAVGAMTIERTLSHGVKAGLLTGLGSSVADCIYAIIGAFGITLVSDFLLEYQLVIHLIGGIFLLIIGVRLFLKQAETALPNPSAIGGIKLFLSSFAIGITNPTAILTFLFAFSYFGISSVVKLQDGIALVGGVFIGTYLWWGTISYVAHRLKQSCAFHGLSHSNKVFGVILTSFGAIVLVKSFFT